MSAISTLDLRSNAKDFGRVKTQKTKWSRGSRGAAGVWHCSHAEAPASLCSPCLKRPKLPLSSNYTTMRHARTQREVNRNYSVAKKAFRGTVAEAVDDTHEDSSDSSEGFDVADSSAAPELNEIMYSFDAPTGPSRGNDILSYALTQAVERFENNETEKIIKTEYDLVLDGKDEPEMYVADADDDFEFIDGTHLK